MGSWPGVVSLSSLSFYSLSSSSDSVWCETLKSFNYQQLLGIHWMHEEWEEEKKMRGDKNERKRIREGRECLMLHIHRPTKPCSILIAAQRELIISSALQSQSCEWVVQPSSDHNPKNTELWWCFPLSLSLSLPFSLSLHLIVVRLAL